MHRKGWCIKPNRKKIMNANYWNTVNEGGEGYVKRAPATRSRDEVEFDLRDAERDSVSAKINAAYKNNEDGSDYKVERLEAKILKLRAELGLPETPAAEVAPAAPAVTPQQKAVTQTQSRMIMGKRRTHADAVRFAKAALSGGQKVNFLAAVKAAFPELY